jgi:hypothetical protein
MNAVPFKITPRDTEILSLIVDAYSARWGINRIVISKRRFQSAVGTPLDRIQVTTPGSQRIVPISLSSFSFELSGLVGGASDLVPAGDALTSTLLKPLHLQIEPRLRV